MKSSKSNLPKVTSRLVALQILYSGDFFEKEYYELVQEDYLDKYKKGEIYSDFVQDGELIVEPDEAFLKKLLQTTSSNLTEVDHYITEHIKKGWTLDKLDPIVRSILRLAITEMLYFGDIPIKVILDQYVSLTNDFYVADEVGFVNGVLDSIAKIVRKDKDDKDIA